MAYTTKAAEYLRGSGATNDEIDDFFDFWSAFKDGGKKNCYKVYRLCARLLSHRQTPYKEAWNIWFPQWFKMVFIYGM